MKGKILVASDGTPGASGALRLARALAERDGVLVEVISVVEPIVPPVTGLADTVAFWRPDLIEAQEEARRGVVAGQLAGVGGDAGAWPVSLQVGSPAPTIVEHARERGVTLLLLGLGRHSLAGRWLRGATAERVLHLAHLPVLVVPANTRALPRCAVVGIDFSEFSLDAARAGAELLGVGAALHLVHVVWTRAGELPLLPEDEWLRTYRAGAERRLEELAAQLREAASVTTETYVICGEQPDEIVSLADRVRAELIAVGSHGMGFLGRVVLGSVSTRLVRAARRPVLIAPPRSFPAELERAPAADPALLTEREVQAELLGR